MVPLEHAYDIGCLEAALRAVDLPAAGWGGYPHHHSSNRPTLLVRNDFSTGTSTSSFFARRRQWPSDVVSVAARTLNSRVSRAGAAPALTAALLLARAPTLVRRICALYQTDY